MSFSGRPADWPRARWGVGGWRPDIELRRVLLGLAYVDARVLLSEGLLVGLRRTCTRGLAARRWDPKGVTCWLPWLPMTAGTPCGMLLLLTAALFEFENPFMSLCP